jgi:hypothetical protein
LQFHIDLLRRGTTLVVDDEVVDVVVVDLGAVVDGRVRNVAPHIVNDVRHHLPVVAHLGLLCSFVLLLACLGNGIGCIALEDDLASIVIVGVVSIR